MRTGHEFLVSVHVIMSWDDSIMEIYFEMRPVYETQCLYKKKDLYPIDYWTLELDWLLNSTWAPDAEFRALPGIDYLLQKYTGPKIQLDDEDRMTLWLRFITELGMNPPTFALKFTPRPPPPSSSA